MNFFLKRGEQYECGLDYLDFWYQIEIFLEKRGNNQRIKITLNIQFTV